MKLVELRRICDGLINTHGDDMDVSFVYPLPHATQRRTKLGNITRYEVNDSYVRFVLNYARSGEAES